jgi:hypothetical protein
MIPFRRGAEQNFSAIAAAMGEPIRASCEIVELDATDGRRFFRIPRAIASRQRIKELPANDHTSLSRLRFSAESARANTAKLRYGCFFKQLVIDEF